MKILQRNLCKLKQSQILRLGIPPQKPLVTLSIHSLGTGQRFSSTGKGGLVGLGKRLLNKSDSPSKSVFRTDLKILSSLLKYVWPKDSLVRQRVVLAFSLLISGKLLNITVPWIFKHIIDALNYSTVDSLHMIGLLVISYGAARIGSIAFQELRNAVFGRVAQSTIREAAKNIFSHLLDLDQSFHQQKQTGGLVRAIDRGTKGINQVLSAAVFHIIPTIFEISVVCGLLTVQFGKEYAYVTLATIMAYSLFTVWTTQWRLGFRKSMNLADNKAASIATDSLLNVEQVQLYNNQNLEVENYDKSLLNYQEAAIKNTTSLSVLNAGQSAIFSVAVAIMMGMASHGVLNGHFTVGDIVMINGLLFQLSMPLNFLGSVYRDTRQSLIDMHSMFTILENKSRLKSSFSKPDYIYKNGNIEFKNVVFGYNGRNILNGVSFEIPAGKKVAFVGSSGSGKSTILKLITGIIESEQGQILIDGQNVSDLNLKTLRHYIATCPQDTILFSQSIQQNIKYGNPNASFDEITHAAKMAEIHTTIVSFQQKYETQVGERGVMLSGGEKQRIQLSRLFLKDPKIALFDEPTSALDQNTEHLIMNSVSKWLSSENQKTAVFIAHRLSTIADCDLIYVLDGGVVVEKGSHEELLTKGGMYAKMWNSQSRIVQ